jgi:hypothetical protein
MREAKSKVHSSLLAVLGEIGPNRFLTATSGMD